MRAAMTAAKQVVADSCIVDVGGDCGQFIPPEASCRLLFDISGKELEVGVERISSLDDERWARVDTVVLSGVLEHLSDPAASLSLFVRSVRPGTLFYIEVPAGVPTDNISGLSSWELMKAYLVSVFPYFWRRKDQSLAARRRKEGVGTRRFLRQSEHLTFFTPKGMEALLSRSNLDVITLQNDAMPNATLESGRVSFEKLIKAVARKAPTL